MIDRYEIGLLRLAAQHIAGAGLASPGEVVSWMMAMQAQDFPGVVTSVALRTGSRQALAVGAAFDAGEIVKSWPMRGTLHLVAAQDLPWLLGLTAPRVVAGAASRRAALGLDLLSLEQARKVATEALSGGRQLRRDELFAAWNGAGVSTDGQRGYHMLGNLAQTGTVCFGPTRDGEQLLVLIDEWITRPRQLERDQALGELALRYFRSHGPATVKDFTRWTNLIAADVKAGMAIARPDLAGIEVDGVEYLMDPATPDALAGSRRTARGVFLLPGFDEFMLGYRDRSAVLPAEFAERIIPGGNGVFQPTVLNAGQVVGTWKRAGKGANRTVVTSPFTPFTGTVAKAIPQAYAALP